MDTGKIGRLGEDSACRYLVDNRYKILKRNWREKWDEIDIVARAINGTLVFVEVKTLSGDRSSWEQLVPEDNMTTAKLKKIRRACEAFVEKNPKLVSEDRGWRIDLLAIELGASGPKIRRYENI